VHLGVRSLVSLSRCAAATVIPLHSGVVVSFRFLCPSGATSEKEKLGGEDVCELCHGLKA
jgi:hypothetical protein